MRIAHRAAASLGPLLALAAALLFGMSTPIAKLLLGSISPWLLAGLLYASAGLGLSIWWGLRAGLISGAQRRAGGGLDGGEAALKRADLPKLAAVIVSGGILAPVLLLLGLSSSEAASTALLLNLEGVFTLALAWLVFHENVDLRVSVGATAIIVGALLLSWQGTSGRWHWGSMAIVAACLAWGIDNNLTRSLSACDPVQVALIKDSIAGVTNLALALWAGARLPSAGIIAGAALLGLLSYGVSTVLFVLALRHLGTARTGAYFSLSSFAGAALAIVLLREPITPTLLIAAAVMALGMWLLLTERHEHLHEHPAMVHEHRHVHDAHHQHSHGPDDTPGEPHTHVHAHGRLLHSHRHFPDIHHRHRHRDRQA